MAFTLPPKELKTKVAESAYGQEDLHSIIGHYFTAFGRAEHQLTRVLAHVLGFKDFEQFDFLSRGMDLRAKCERLEKAARLRSPMGMNISARIALFNDRCRKARNDLAHSDLAIISGSIVCLGVGVTHTGKPDNVRPTGGKPTRYTLNEVRSQILWLTEFAQDLNECAERTWHGQSFEVASPRSSLP